jgi:acetate CoA/acetoacetate CoA-transferase alpha subunit
MEIGMRETSPDRIAAMISEGSTIMIGGFMTLGSPSNIIDAIVHKKIGELKVIANDAGFPDRGVGRLIRAGLVKKLYASHVGTNRDVSDLVDEGRIDLVLIPQGTLAEQIRAAGAGLGGVLTPTGVGTSAAEGKEILIVDGKEFILELPLAADFAFIHARWADSAGNLIFEGTTRNFCPLMAMAAETVIAQADDICEKEYLNPNHIHTPGIFVDYLIKTEF